MYIQTLLYGDLKVIPQYCIAHHVLRIISCVISARTSARTVRTKMVSFEDELAKSMKDCFLLNEYGDLSFFSHNFSPLVLLFAL